MNHITKGTRNLVNNLKPNNNKNPNIVIITITKIPNINLVLHESYYKKNPTFQSRKPTKTMNQTTKKPNIVIIKHDKTR